MSWSVLVLCSALLAVVSAQHKHVYFRFPVDKAHINDCYDSQVDEYFKVGDVWSSKYSNCKQSTCVYVQEEDTYYIDRVRCDNLVARIDLDVVKERGYRCRRTAPNRNKEFPDCCGNVKCYEYDINNQKRDIPEEEIPWKAQIQDSILKV